MSESLSEKSSSDAGEDEVLSLLSLPFGVIPLTRWIDVLFSSQSTACAHR